MDKLLKAFANKRRLAIIQLLKSKKNLSVSDLARGIKLSLRSTSRHLSILHHVNVVDREQKGLTVFYALVPSLSALAKDILKHL